LQPEAFGLKSASIPSRRSGAAQARRAQTTHAHCQPLSHLLNLQQLARRFLRRPLQVRHMHSPPAFSTGSRDTLPPLSISLALHRVIEIQDQSISDTLPPAKSEEVID
jgi:hypothetical protein